MARNSMCAYFSYATYFSYAAYFRTCKLMYVGAYVQVRWLQWKQWLFYTGYFRRKGVPNKQKWNTYTNNHFTLSRNSFSYVQVKHVHVR